MASNEVIISLSNVVRKFGDFNAVDGFSLDIKRGQFVTILGPSGCGKTTTLRMIGGFELPTSGTILLNGEDITTDDLNKILSMMKLLCVLKVDGWYIKDAYFDDM